MSMIKPDTSTKNISDLLREKQTLFSEIEADQWRRWQRRNQSRPKFPKNLQGLKEEEIKTIFSPDSGLDKAVGQEFVSQIMKRYQDELLEIELPAPEQLQNELKSQDIELRKY